MCAWDVFRVFYLPYFTDFLLHEKVGLKEESPSDHLSKDQGSNASEKIRYKVGALVVIGPDAIFGDLGGHHVCF